MVSNNCLVYVSSKLKHRDRWITSGLTMTSSWINSPELSPDECSDMWDRYRLEILEAKFFILYLEPDDLLKGCILELGIAFTSNLPIIIIWSGGTMADLAAKVGTIVYHKNVYRVPDLDGAINKLTKLNEREV